MKTIVLSFGCGLLAACGGKATVDLGSNGAGWGDTNGSATATTATTTTNPVAVPKTLYNGDIVRTIAVDESTIVAVIMDPVGNHQIDMCQLAECQSTRQTIYQESYNECFDSGAWSESRLDHVLISHGEVIWPACRAGDISLQACATSGCTNGARRLAPVASVQALAASADWIYWWDEALNSGIARCPRAGCETAEFPQMTDASAAAFTRSHFPFPLTLDEATGMLYASSGQEIFRMPADFSTDWTLFVQERVAVSGVAFAGEYAYFALSTLTGQIRRCPKAGCEQGSELVTMAPRWPVGPNADEKAVYWFEQAQTNYVTPNALSDGVISAFYLDRAASGAIDVARFGFGFGRSTDSVLVGHSRLAMNSHHLYWIDANDNDPSTKSAIRMVER